MKRGMIFLLICLTLLLYGVLADQITIQPNSTEGKDTYLQEDDNTMVSGTATNIDLGQFWVDSAKRGLLEFNLSSIPSGKVIGSAILKLYMYNAGAGPGTNTNLSVHRITRSWIEGTSGYTDNGANWFTHNGTENWAASGGDFDSQFVDSQITNSTGYYSWNITELVRGGYNGSYANYGFLLKGVDEISDLNLRKRFRSSDWGAAVLERPQIVVDYFNESIDEIFPLIEFTQGTEPNNSNKNQNWIFINVTVNESNEDTLIFNLYNFTSLINSFSFTNQSREINFTNLQDGSYFYNVSVNDTSGNENSTLTRLISLDTLLPVLSIFSPNNLTYSVNTILVNLSAQDANLDSIWFYNGTDNLSYSSPDNYTFSEGSHTFFVYANDSAGNLNFTSIDFYVDVSGPFINLSFPEQKTYGYNISLPLNFSVSDSSGVDSCWYNLNWGANISLDSCQNSTFNASDGGHVLYFFSNDSFGFVSSVSRDFSVSTTLAVDLISPSHGSWSNDGNILFEYGVVTSSDLYNCSLWGNWGGGWHMNQSNLSFVNVAGGSNNFSVFLEDGHYIWNIFCDGTYDSFAFTNKTFHVDSIHPEIVNLFPMNNSLYERNISMNFSFNLTEINLDYCLYSFDGGLTNESINCDEGFNELSLDSQEGNYNFTIYAVDLADGVGSFIIHNLSINYDSFAPSVEILEPFGEKTSSIGIPLQPFIADNVDSLEELNCFFSVFYTFTNGIVPGLSNVNLPGCSDAIFNVLGDGSYRLDLTVLDLSGNQNFSSSSFSVDTSVPPSSSSSSSSSGGGGGGYANPSIVSGINHLELQALPKLIMKKGDSKQLTLRVRNAGTNFLNDCQFKAKRDFSSWIKSSGVKDLSAGEIYEFGFELIIPKEVQSKINTVGFDVGCKETNASGSFEVEIIDEKLKFTLIELKRQDENYVKLVYSLQELFGIEQNVELQFLLSNGEKTIEVKDNQTISAFEEESFGVLIPVDPTLEGEFNLLVNLNSENYSGFFEEDVILGAPLSGFTLFGDPGKMNTYISLGIIILFCIFAFFKLRNIFRHKKELNKRKKVKILKDSNTDKLILIKKKHKKRIFR